MKSFLSILFLCLVSITAFAQRDHREGEKDAQLIPGLGAQHHKVSTDNAEAQKFFDQGLLLVYAFNHEEAARSFQQAAKLDPQLAMAHWGVALAVGPNYNLDVDPDREKIAYEAIQKALSIANQPGVKITPQERAYIDAMSKRYSNDPKPDFKKLALDYKIAMGELHKKYPDDNDAATLYADSMMNLKPWQLWTPDGKPAEGTLEIVAVLESVLKKDPKHIGAIHFYIHAVEASPNPERALAYAPMLPKLTPAAGHLVHMPAHIYMRTGDYDAAADSNIDAAKADEAYIKSSGAQGIYPMMYYSHNLDFLRAARAMEGRYKDAMDAEERLVANISPMIKEMPMVEVMLSTKVLLQIRFNKWDDILKLPEPDKSLVVSNVYWHYARGRAFAATGKTDEADAELAAFQSIVKTLPADLPGGNNPESAILNIADLVLRGKIAQAKHDTKTAVDLYTKAIAAEDALVYDEPPPWSSPTRESLAALYYLTGDFAAAEKTFKEELSKHPHNGRALFGLAESLKAQHKKVAAAAAQKEFETAWKNADTKLRMEDL
ncbi:MAG TPA: tetratricopeptide repeat protein [Blastocatellia bacterium]|nr:tetratricopeptide repeat protein [Blastocatellia bacterium]